MGFLSAANDNDNPAQWANNSRTTLALALLVLALIYFIRQSSVRSTRVTYSLHPWLPAFVSGMHAAISLGTDETTFLLDLKKRYGSVVYIPFPLAKHFVLDNDLLKAVFEGKYNKQLSFTPFRIEASNTLFGISKKVLHDERMQKHIFPVMTKGLMSNSLLRPSLDRFASEVERRLDVLDSGMSSGQASDSVDLVSWAFDTVFESAKIALFGYQCPGIDDFVKKNFLAYDDAFPLLAAGFIPPPMLYYLPATRAGVLARDRLSLAFGTWVRDTGCAGLETGDVIKDLMLEAQSQMQNDGKPLWTVNDLGMTCVADIWALETNSTHAVCWCMLYLVQAEDQLKAKILEEVDAITLSSSIGAAETPLLTSMIYETLRLRISAYTVRRSISETPFTLGQNQVQPKEEVLIIQRASNLDETVWGENARVWDPLRFYDAPGSETNKAKRIQEVRAFGGGSSKVAGYPLFPHASLADTLQCEGRVLAIAELRIFLVGLLKKFDIKLSESAASVCKDRAECLTLQNEIRMAILPEVKPGRPGTGAYQILGQVPVTIKPRKAV